MRVECAERLEDVLDGWAELHARDPLATPFASPGWARAWWEHWAAGARPRIVTVHDEGVLVGLAPFALRRVGPVRVLVGIGRHPGDYWAPLALPAAREGVMAAVAHALAERAGEWDLLVASGLAPGLPLESALTGAGHRVVHRAPSPCPAIDLPASFEDYEASLPRSRRGNLRRHLRRLDDGELALRSVREPHELHEAIGRWRVLRERQWQAAGRRLAAMHRGARFEAFLRDVALALVPAGLAEVREFRVGERVAGVYVDFCDVRAFHWFLGGFDPAFAGMGLGKIAAGEAIRSSIAAGRRSFDFAHGAEAYKYWFGASDRMSTSLLVAGPRTRAHAALGAAALLARLRDRPAVVA
ncbi:MAG TPA: GNAT family N-acetyltransferase [Solirubrobacteraceae bacterium]|nr:GNAT family N-acetyltransferase [Solirubrobacteraceae bacterium]